MTKYIVKCLAITGLDQNFRKKPLALPFSRIDHVSGTMDRRYFPEDLAQIVRKYHGTTYQGKDANKAMNAFFTQARCEDNLETTNWDWFDGLSVQYSSKHDKQYTITWKMFEKTFWGEQEVTSKSENVKRRW